MDLTLSGHDASVRWGYQLGAILRSWVMTRGAEGWSLTATIVSVDTFRIAQRPLVFIAPHANGSWRFPVLELQVSGASVTGRLGPREIPHAIANCAT